MNVQKQLRRCILCCLAPAAGLFAGACDAVVDPAGLRPDANAAYAAAAPRFARPPQPPVLQTNTPAYPAAVVYILYREYLHRNPGTTTLNVDDPKYQQYMERRLRELYPARGYSGMMREAVAEARRNEAAWRRYEDELGTYQRNAVTQSTCEVQALAYENPDDPCTGGGGGGGDGGGDGTYTDPYADPYVDPSWDGKVEFEVPADEFLPTIEMEIDSLMLEGAEVDQIYYYESLATGTYRTDDPAQMQSVGGAPSLDDLIRAAGEGYVPAHSGPITQISPAVVAGGIAFLGVIGWKAYRIDQATRRAIARSEYYYPHLAYDNTKRDAYRHIFWSMMLRRYAGATLAKSITDYHERESTGGGKVMDLHNNDIGRSYRYNRFRNHWAWDRWDWHEWGRRVRDYINNEAEHGTYIPEWQAGVTTEVAWQRESSVPASRYIYFEQ